VHILDFRFVKNGIHNRWQPVGKKLHSNTETFFYQDTPERCRECYWWLPTL